MRARLKSFLRALLRPENLRQELDEELRFHLEARAEALESQGLSPEAARRQARIELGSAVLAQEEARTARGVGFADALGQDLRFALRGLHRNPGFALVAVATLALGIGANTAVFSVVNAVLLRPVAAPDPDNVVVFGTARENLPPTGGSPTRFNAWRRLDALFQDISAYRYTAMNLTGLDTPRRVQVAQVSEGYFRLFGLTAAQGRTFTAEEDRPNGGGFAVVSDAFANAIFGSEAALGERLMLGGAPHVIVGVLPQGIETEARERIDVWIPFQLDPESLDQGHFFAVAGRVRPGVTPAEIETGLAVASDEFAEKFPDIGARLGGSRFVARRIQEVAGQNARPALMMMLGAVGLVLLIACANIANLLLARATVREREIALRASLGATRGRLVRQLLTEAGVLWALGTVCGLGLGVAGVRVLLGLEPGSLPRLSEGAGVDWRVLAFTVGASLVTAALFAAYPAVRASRADLLGATRRDGTRARSALVAGEIALALMLAVASGLLIRTFVAMRAVEPGFDPGEVLTMQALLDDKRYSNTAGLNGLVERSVAAIEAMPGVEAAAAGCCPPVGSVPNVSFGIAGRPIDGGASPRANVPTISPHYFAVHRIPLLEGRAFTEADVAQSPKVVVVNRELARRYWPTGDALGAQVTIGAGDATVYEIVGVAGDVRDRMSGEVGPTIYTPLAQSPDGATAYNVRRPTHWMVRTRGDLAGVRDSLRDVVERASGLPVIEVQTMEQGLARSTAEPDFRLALMLTFGTLGLLLAGVGVYGLVSFEAAQRRKDIGVRLALGAQGKDIRRLILLRTSRLSAWGLALGLIAAYALSGLMSSFLFGVEAHDPAVFAASAAVLGGAAILASVVPVVRASRLSPVAALRHD